jgi:hypothetical protein
MDDEEEAVAMDVSGKELHHDLMVVHIKGRLRQ